MIAKECRVRIGFLDPVTVRAAPSVLVRPGLHGLVVSCTTDVPDVLWAVTATLLRTIGVMGTEIAGGTGPAGCLVVVIREAFRGAWPVAPHDAMAVLEEETRSATQIWSREQIR